MKQNHFHYNSTIAPINYLEMGSRLFSACSSNSTSDLETLMHAYIQQIIREVPDAPQGSLLEYIKSTILFGNAFLYYKFSDLSSCNLSLTQSVAEQINRFVFRLSSVEDVSLRCPYVYNGYFLLYNAYLSSQKHYSQLIQNVLNSLYTIFTTGDNIGDMSVSYFANQFHVSEKYLSTRFIRETGKSLSQEIIQVRVLSAQFFLQYSLLSLEEIAEKTGFKNGSYFSRRFKACVGMSPKQYRLHTQRAATNKK